MSSTALRVIVPDAENGTVTNHPPRRRKNAELREREYLTEPEVERLIAAAGDGNRWRTRDQAMIPLAYRHGLRAAEVCNLTWDQIEFGAGRLHVRRRKNGRDSVHPLGGREQRLLRKLQREVAEQCPDGRFVFLSERGGPVSEAGFRKMLARLGAAAEFGFGVHHTCSAMAAGTSSPTLARTRGRCKTTLVTRTSSTPFATPSLRPIASTASGKTAGAAHDMSQLASAPRCRPFAGRLKHSLGARLKPEGVQAWLGGGKRIPDNVAEWLEALAAAHEQRPHPEGWFERQNGAVAARIVFARRPSRRE